MPPKRTIITDPDVILRSLFAEEKARLSAAESERVRQREAERERLRREWAEPPIIIAESRPPFHYLRDNFASLDAVLSDHKLAGPGEPTTFDQIDPWQPYDLAQLVGREVTPSERIRWQQCIRKMKADGLVLTNPPGRPTELALTEKGFDAATELEAQP